VGLHWVGVCTKVIFLFNAAYPTCHFDQRKKSIHGHERTLSIFIDFSLSFEMTGYIIEIAPFLTMTH
jgi:hypothetical protein